MRETLEEAAEDAVAYANAGALLGAEGVMPDEEVDAGPAQEFSRHWLAGRATTTPERAEDVLAAAAWHALTTTEESR